MASIQAGRLASWVVLISAVFIPGAPALVPEVSGPGVVELDPVRTAMQVAIAEQALLSGSWWGVGVADSTADSQSGEVLGVGSFGGFGVDRHVALQPGPNAAPGESHLPTSMLIAGWARELAPEAHPVVISPVVVAAGAGPATCRAVGADLAARLAAGPEAVGLLVVGDGAINLSDGAPGGGCAPDAVALQADIDAALASGDPDAVRELDWDRCARWGARGRGVWEVAAACAPSSATATVGYAGAPFGVGYNVVTWRFG